MAASASRSSASTSTGGGLNEIWRFPEIVAYFRSDPEISAVITDDEFHKITDYSSDWIKLVRAALENQGFDPSSASRSSASTSTGGDLNEIWRFPEIVAYFLSDPEISAVITDDEFHKITDYSSDWIKLVRAALENQGFDPRVILAQLIRNRKAYEAGKPVLMEWDLTNTGDNLSMTATTKSENKFSNKESLHRDVNFMITVFLSGNNHINKILKKSRGGVGGILKMLKEKYNISYDIQKSGTTLESRVITLPMIADVFPTASVRMFHDRIVKEIVSYDKFPGTIKPETHAICCPLLPSVTPMSLKKDIGSNFHPVMLWTAIKLDEIIHRNDEQVTSISDILTYYRASYQSSATPEQTRMKVFTFLGLVVDNKDAKVVADKVLSPEAKSLASACLTALKTMRLGEENHNLLLKVASDGNFDLF